MRLKSLTFLCLMSSRHCVMLPYAAIVALVMQKILKGLLGVWNIYILTHPKVKKLWGQEQCDDFVRKMVILALYKDLFSVGFECITKTVDVGFKFRSKALRHNTKLIRKILAEWSEKQILNEGRRVWDKNCDLLPRRKGLHDVNLLIDSSDFCHSVKQSTSTKDSCWSFKLNGPGQRYTVVIDAWGVVQKVWGGYSPKTYDGDWVRLCANDLLTNFKGAHIIGDVYYELGNRIMKGIQATPSVNFYVPFSEPRGCKHQLKRIPL